MLFTIGELSSSKAWVGTTLVIKPRLSLVKADFLNPFDDKATAPKLELEFVNEISPPFTHSKCFAYPIANIETAWTTASLEILIWVFSYPGL